MNDIYVGWGALGACPQGKVHIIEIWRVYFKHFYCVTEVATHSL